MSERPHLHPVDPARVEQARGQGLGAEEAAASVRTLRLLGDPTRARVVAALGSGLELCVGDIALALGVGENAVSYALGRLRRAGIVRARRSGRVVYYVLAEPRAAELVAAARALAEHEPGRPQRPRPVRGFDISSGR